MRRKTLVASAGLMAALALAAMPVPAGSRGPSPELTLDPGAFEPVTVVANEPQGAFDATAETSARSRGFLDGDARFSEPGRPPNGPTDRPAVRLPTSPVGSAWKPPRYVISGEASFYDNGTTAMRIPRGSFVRICGRGGCIERTVTDYGPASWTGRVIDMYRRDFFAVCGCPSFSGTTRVTISVY